VSKLRFTVVAFDNGYVVIVINDEFNSWELPWLRIQAWRRV
jgi:hypothetical protein